MLILGHQFFDGTLSAAIDQALKGGLVLVPSGPGMGDDLVRSPVYAASLAAADLLLPDSGAMVLLANWLLPEARQRPLQRLSGLTFLKALLADPRTQGASTFWVMPTEQIGADNLQWLRGHGFPQLDASSTYVAPRYAPEAPVDSALVALLEARRPALIFLNVGGGTQEPLGAWLKAALSYRPTIICTGAAIAFLSGQQVRIPSWADRLYLGWLFRIASAPSRFLPRYLRALRLFPLMWRYRAARPPCRPGSASPPVADRSVSAPLKG